MTFLDRWAMAWLTAHGCRVAEPGTPDPADPAVAAKMLREKGFRLFAPGVDLPVPPVTLADARTALEGQHYTVLEPGEEPLYGLDRADAALKAAGYKVFPPEQPPELGWWDDKLPDSSSDPAHPSRDVLSVLDGIVSYVKAGSPQVHTCKIGGFHKWRRDAHATHRPAAPEPVLPPIPEDAA